MPGFMIETFARWLLGGSYWVRIKHMVSVIDDSGLDGKAKREQVFKDATAIGFDLAEWLINAGIELAVVYLRKKASS